MTPSIHHPHPKTFNTLCIQCHESYFFFQIQQENGFDNFYWPYRDDVHKELKTYRKDMKAARIFTRDPFCASFEVSRLIYPTAWIERGFN